MGHARTLCRCVFYAWCLVAVAGCAGTGYEFSEQFRRELLASMDGPDSVTYGSIVAYYPRGKEGVARRCAEEFARQLDHAADATGIEWVFKRFNLYFKAVDKVSPLDRWAFLESENTFGVVLYVEPGDESYEVVVAKNVWYPLSVIHEIAECSLTQLQLDRRWKSWRGEEKKTLGYTRWFREGFPEYAGFLAHNMMMRDQQNVWQRFPKGMYQRDFSNHPFSALQRVGVSLFKWHQFYKGPAIQPDISPNLPHVGNRDIDYYSAAFGLFLLIEDRSGRDSIKEMIRSIGGLKDADGEAVKGIVSRALGTDVVKFVEDFRFPEVGLYMNEYWPGYTPNAPAGLPIKEGLYVLQVGQGSPAQRSGMRSGDVVLSLDGEQTVTNFDFECALYKHRRQKSVQMGIWREGTGNSTIEVRLEDDVCDQPRRGLPVDVKGSPVTGQPAGRATQPAAEPGG